jgi:hypothetical protein
MKATTPLATGVTLAVLSALAFGVTIPVIAWAGQDVGASTTASALYAGAPLAGTTARRRAHWRCSAAGNRSCYGASCCGPIAPPVEFAHVKLAWPVLNSKGMSSQRIYELFAAMVLSLCSCTGVDDGSDDFDDDIADGDEGKADGVGSTVIHPPNSRVEIRVTNKYSVMRREILAMANQVDAAETLVAFDIDNTILITQECLPAGSAGGLAGFLKKVRECPADLTEARVPRDIRAIQRKGFDTAALTARANVLTAATERELTRHNISFLNKPFTADDNVEVAFPTGRSMFFTNGITYAAGRDKGVILQQFQAQLPAPYANVIFVDDRKENVDDVEVAYRNDETTKVIVYHYNRLP